MDDKCKAFILCIIIETIMCIPLLIFFSFLNLTPSPAFTLHDVKLTTFNFSTTNTTLTSNLQITISARNREEDYKARTDADNAFRFEKINVYASYRNQQITPPTMLPPMYLGSPDVTVWSLSLNGTDVPLSPDLGPYLVQDVTVGNVFVNVEVTGRLKSEWGFLSRQYRLKVNCPEYIMFGFNNDVVGSAVKHPLVEGCRVGVTPLKTVMQHLASGSYKLVPFLFISSLTFAVVRKIYYYLELKS